MSSDAQRFTLTFEEPGAAPLVEPAIASGLSVVSFGQGNDGEVYVIHFSGNLHRVIAAP